jgi:DNA-binding response OmpR family regulator
MPPTPVILAVNRNQRNLELLRQFLGTAGYQLSPAASPEAFDRALASSEVIGLTLVDIAGFDLRIWDRCEGLRARRIPFLVLSPHQSAALQQTSLSHGAHGVLVKPLVMQELLGLMRSLLEEG